MANQFLGRADSATSLESIRSIFGQYFDGTANVKGKALVYGTGVASGRYANGGLEVREANLVTTTQKSTQYAPRIGFHWGGTQGKSLIMDSSGNFKFTNNDADTDYAPLYAKFIGDLTGNATSATTATTATKATSADKWTTARTLTLTGHASGSVSMDGSANVSINVNNNYAATAGQVALLYTADTRTTNPAPSTYARGFQTEFKGNTAIGSPGSGTYSGVVTFAPWSETSGGNKYQLNFAYASDGNPLLSIRTADASASSWGVWKYIPIMEQVGGYWGFKFPSNSTYLRTPPNGLLPHAQGTSNSTVLGTSSWRFNSAYINTVYGSLSGNATTATTATNATQLGGVAASGYLRTTGGVLSGSNASISRAAAGSSWYNARNYAIFKMTSSSNYSPMWSAKTADGSWDCGTYISNRLYFTYITDANYNSNTNTATGQFYVDTDGSITAPAFKGNATSATTATNSNQLGGIAAASYINTSDTLILRGVV